MISRLLSLLIFMLFAGQTYAACTSPAGQAGQMVYASTQAVMVYCNGTDWVSMAGGVSVTVGGVTNNPGGNNSEIQYNNGGAFGASSNFTYGSGVVTLTGTVTATNVYGGSISGSTGTFGAISAGQVTATAVGAGLISATAATGTVSATNHYGNSISGTTGTFGGLTVSGVATAGTVTATNVYGGGISGTIGAFGSLTVGGVAVTGGGSTDRIYAGTSSVTINSNGYVSLSTGGTTWGYLSSGASYIPSLTTVTVTTSRMYMQNIGLSPAPQAYLQNYFVNISPTGVVVYATGTMAGIFDYRSTLTATGVEVSSTFDGSDDAFTSLRAGTLELRLTSSAGATPNVLLNTSGLYGVGTISTTSGGKISATNISATMIQVGAGSTCVAGTVGGIRYNSTSNSLQICTGATGWKSMPSSTTAGGAVAAETISLTDLSDVSISTANTQFFAGTGTGVGYYGTTNIGNIGIGLEALSTTTTGAYNTAVGYQALNSTVDNQMNTAVGYQAAKTLTSTGSGNTAIGYRALLGTQLGSNTVIGAYAMGAGTNGSGNVAVGASTLYKNAAGAANVGVGSNAMNENATGNWNVAMGNSALYYNQNGSGNVIIGYNAGQGGSGNSLNFNTVMGYFGGNGISTGAANVLIGSHVAVNLSNGNSNTIIGQRAGATLTGGRFNIIIGAGADVPASGVSGSLNIGNAISGSMLSGGSLTFIGGIQANGVVTATYFEGNGSRLSGLSGGAIDRISTSAVASGANLGMVVADQGTVSFTLAGVAGAAYLHGTLGLVGPGVSTTGPISGTAVFASGNMTATAYLHSSDRNLKKDIVPISNAGGLLKGLTGVHFSWKKDGTPSYGVIAQDVQKVMPEAVKGGSGTLVVDYDQLIAPLIEVVKHQQLQIDELRKQVDALRQQQGH